MPRRKSRRATTYNQRPNALSALDIHTMMSYQRFQALCAISLVRSHQMFMLSMMDGRIKRKREDSDKDHCSGRNVGKTSEEDEEKERHNNKNEE